MQAHKCPILPVLGVFACFSEEAYTLAAHAIIPVLFLNYPIKAFSTSWPSG
jgi:hypothetical protein